MVRDCRLGQAQGGGEVANTDRGARLAERREHLQAGRVGQDLEYVHRRIDRRRLEAQVDIAAVAALTDWEGHLHDSIIALA